MTILKCLTTFLAGFVVVVVLPWISILGSAWVLRHPERFGSAVLWLAILIMAFWIVGLLNFVYACVTVGECPSDLEPYEFSDIGRRY